jgi:simple sugar transport system permease protein
MITLVLAAAAVGGGLWAGVAALLRSWRGVSEVLGTLLLVFIAMQIVSLAVSRSYLLRQPAPVGPTGQVLNRNLASAKIPEALRLGHIEFLGNSVHIGFVLALVAAVILGILYARSVWGFRLRLLGLNPTVAHRAGIRSATLGAWALMLSGALAGLAGGVMLTAREFQLSDGFSNNIGWEGLLVALVARNRPAAIVPAAIFFGMLRSGGGLLVATGVARFIVEVVQALLVLSLLLPPLYMEARTRRRLALEMAERV